VNASAQVAGIAALKEAKADTLRMKEIYNKRRLYMIERLRAMDRLEAYFKARG